MLLVPMIDVADADNYSQVTERMQAVQENSIACVNWPGLYPSKPEVAFKIAHNGTHLFLQYFVQENEILAKTAEDNGPVWTDSCVEFFLSLGEPYYYNLETSCIGTALLGYRVAGEHAVHAEAGVMSQIKRYPSLGREPFDKRQGDFEWNMLIVVPVSAFWKSDLKTFSGIKARANFYKCGDNLTVPHFLSWNPIVTEKPSFHQPSFFGDLHFE